MAKDFSFPFYVNNWIGGTSYLSFEQKGAYLELLLLQFNHGKFKESQVKQVLNISYSCVWPEIQHKFITDGTFFWNEKMETVKEERRLYVESRRNNRLGKVSPSHDEHEKNISKTYVKRMEGESKDEDIVNGFNEFWKEYPKKKSKGTAEKWWLKHRPSHELFSKIIISLINLKKSNEWTKDNGKYIPHPASWLNAKGWEDEIATDTSASLLYTQKMVL